MKSQSSEMVSIFVFCLFKQTSFYLNGIYKKVIGFLDDPLNEKFVLFDKNGEHIEKMRHYFFDKF